jgi:hypothetical protein
MPTIAAPRKLNRMLGIPNVAIIFLSNPCLKKLILPRLPNKWDIAQELMLFENLQKIEQEVKLVSISIFL